MHITMTAMCLSTDEQELTNCIYLNSGFEFVPEILNLNPKKMHD